MVRRGIVSSRTTAQQLVAGGTVLVAGAVAERTSRLVAPGEAIVISGPPPPFVSRGGEKLVAALEAFALDVSGLRALDAGASTGGFTDCLLKRGALQVVAVDVGRGQLHERLRSDRRVVVMERTNVRDLRPEGVPGAPFPLVTADLSFISLVTVGPALLGLAAPGADMVLLIKPQFEAGRKAVSKGKGVVRDPEVRAAALHRVISALEEQGAAMMGVMVSPLRGADGNIEFLARFKAHRPAPAEPVTARLERLRPQPGDPAGW